MALYSYCGGHRQPAVKALGAGQSLADTFTYTVTNGATSAQTTLTVTVVGVNDAPDIGGVNTNSVTEDVAVNAGGNLTTDGKYAHHHRRRSGPVQLHAAG